MKKPIISFCFIIIQLFSVFFIFAELNQKSGIYIIPKSMIIDGPLEEGFYPGTLIKTPAGYVEIENIVIDDVVIDSQGAPTEVLAITKIFVNQYVKIYINDTVVRVGNDQRLCFDRDYVWIKACEVPRGEYVHHFSVLYSLTTKSHTLCVTPYDISVHNLTAIVGQLGISLGYVAIVNPVVAMLGGAAISLAVVLYNAQQEYMQKYENKEYFLDIPDAVMLADRFYYVSRKNDLEKIQQELLTVKSDLKIINGLYSGCFTSQLLSHYTYHLPKNIFLPAIDHEKKLSHDQKNMLRNSREKELQLLEQQVEDMQILLALHVNQLIDNLQYAQQSYANALVAIEKAITSWNNNLNKINFEIAWNSYKYDLLREFLINEVREAFNELLLITEYYRVCMSECIRSSTTIITVLDQIFSIVQERESWILKEEELARANSGIVEAYFAMQNISVQRFKNEAKKEFEKQQKNHMQEVLEKIENQKIKICFGGGPKKDDDDDDENRNAKVEIYEKNAAHIFRNEPGHFPFDTPFARKLLIDTASDCKNFLGKCKYGNEWYSKILENGQQVWASVRNGFIRNGGLNKIPHNFNSETGLSRLMR